MRRKNPLPVRRLDGATVAHAAAAELPGEHVETRPFAGKRHKIELLSPWGWHEPCHAKVAKARAIADRLESAGLVVAFDVLETGGLDVIFELV